MIMRYFGGGIGHLGNSPGRANSEKPDAEPEEEMEIDDYGNDNLNTSRPGELEDIIMSYDVENSDDERGLGPESESDSDEESDKNLDDSESSEEDLNERASVVSEDSDDDGYGSF
jgi:hypothetical protein